VSVRRVGGTRHKTRYNQLGLPVIDLAVFSDEGLVEAEELYEEALEALYAGVREHTPIQGVGYLHSLKGLRGLSGPVSPFPDTWMVQGALRLGLRPAS
jgi:hypothetical protein